MFMARRIDRSAVVPIYRRRVEEKSQSDQERPAVGATDSVAEGEVR